MSVSSVKNLNGETFSAVQDLELTNFVQTNSGSWGGGTSLTGDAQGAVDEVYSNSADWNSNYSTVNANSGTWTNGGFTGEVYGISGVSPNVEVYIDQQTLWISAAGGGGTTYTGDAQGALDEVYANSGIWLTAHQDISNKLDTTAFSDVSGSFLTAINIPESATWNDVSTTVQTNSADWASHQDLSYISGQVDNKLDTTAFSTVSGTFLTAHQAISANEWNSVYETVENYSGSWTGGGGGSIDTIPFVVQEPLVTGFTGDSAFIGLNSTAINLSAYIPYSALSDDFYSDNNVHTINGSGIYAMTANWSNNCDYAQTAYCDGNGNTITNYYQPKLNIAGSAGTITAINGSAVGATLPEGWELVGSAGISIVDDSANNQTIISVTGGGGDLSNYYTKTETSSKIELDNAIGNIETLLASL